MILIDVCDDWAIFELDLAFWTTRLENFKWIKILCIREKLYDLRQI